MLDYPVIIKTHSFLDSSVYEESGPPLVALVQKAINFIVSAQVMFKS